MDIFDLQKLTSKSTIAIICFILFALYRLFVVHASLPSDGEAYLKSWLAGEYTSAVLATKPEKASEAELIAWSSAFVRAEDITFVTLKVRGMTRDNIIVKAEVRVKGETPPDGRPIRYIRMDYSLLTGWIHKRETSPLFYYMLLF